MKKQLSYEQYRSIDLTLFAVMLTAFEFLIVKAARSWFPDQLYTVSLAAAITCIVMMRWGAWSAFHAVLAGFVFCLWSGGTLQHYMIYMLGNLLSLGALVFYKVAGPENIRKSPYQSLLFALTVSVLMLLGRFLAAMLFGISADAAFGFVTTDTLSILFTLVIIWISRRLDGVFENQKIYLLRINSDSEEGKGGTL